MKTTICSTQRPAAGFTLIELLVVIGVMLILAGIIIPVASRVGKNQELNVAKSEMAQVAAAIESYKARYGHYPPDGSNVFRNPLYLELVGTTHYPTNGGDIGFETLDNSYQVRGIDLNNAFGVGGLVNSAVNAQGTDEQPGPTTFLKQLKPAQVSTLGSVKVLVCSVVWTKPNESEVNPWRYNSSHPTNNLGSFDLWVDLFRSDNRTNRICNWSKVPLIVP